MGPYWTAAALSSALITSAEAWNDIAGALTYKGTSHVFQVRSAGEASYSPGSRRVTRSPCARRAAPAAGNQGRRRKGGTTPHQSE